MWCFYYDNVMSAGKHVVSQAFLKFKFIHWPKTKMTSIDWTITLKKSSWQINCWTCGNTKGPSSFSVLQLKSCFSCIEGKCNYLLHSDVLHIHLLPIEWQQFIALEATFLSGETLLFCLNSTCIISWTWNMLLLKYIITLVTWLFHLWSDGNLHSRVSACTSRIGHMVAWLSLSGDTRRQKTFNFQLVLFY